MSCREKFSSHRLDCGAAICRTKINVSSRPVWHLRHHTRGHAVTFSCGDAGSQLLWSVEWNWRQEVRRCCFLTWKCTAVLVCGLTLKTAACTRSVMHPSNALHSTYHRLFFSLGGACRLNCSAEVLIGLEGWWETNVYFNCKYSLCLQIYAADNWSCQITTVSAVFGRESWIPPQL